MSDSPVSNAQKKRSVARTLGQAAKLGTVLRPAQESIAHSATLDLPGPLV
jgi:hypothetical protein